MSANEHLSPEQFKAAYRPSEYAKDWADVPDSPAYDYDGSDGWSHPSLVEDIAKHGVQEPVGVYKGYVVEGHHRAAAALEAGAKIPIEHWPSEAYEGQIKGKRR